MAAKSGLSSDCVNEDLIARVGNLSVVDASATDKDAEKLPNTGMQLESVSNSQPLYAPQSNPNESITTSDDSDKEQPEVKENIVNVKEAFYSDAKKYWSNIEPTVDGMLGGFERLNAADVRGSRDYLQSMFRIKPAPRRRVALDCGAGIGRVTKRVLMPEYDRVDAVEQDKKFSDKIAEYVGQSPKLGEVFNLGLQEFTPEPGKYDLIWTQWVLGHLTDDDLVAFFKRCILGLSKNGMIIIKENVTATSPHAEIDLNDSSVTRPIMHLKQLIVRSGLRILRVSLQSGFPAGILPVYMITAKPPLK